MNSGGKKEGKRARRHIVRETRGCIFSRPLAKAKRHAELEGRRKSTPSDSTGRGPEVPDSILAHSKKEKKEWWVLPATVWGQRGIFSTEKKNDDSRKNRQILTLIYSSAPTAR